MQVNSPVKKQLFLFGQSGDTSASSDVENAGPQDSVAPFTLEKTSATTGVLSLSEMLQMVKAGSSNEAPVVGRHEFEILQSFAAKPDPNLPPMGYKPNPQAGSPHQPKFIRDESRPDINAFYRGYC